ncbi:MAG TPA: glycerophosphodiester phosphodiesterase [Nocardioidaceae bacterium]|nr:glycerophosphodiester phosphodiesterase [Nocardioidaceae bacterium]
MTRPRTGFSFLDSGLDQPGSVLAFAHRGGAFHPALEGLENTLTAFQHAVELGYTYLETDVHATRDGVLLAFHDSALDRVTEQQGRIRDLDHVDVAAAMVGGREQIPTLESLLAAFPHVRFNIDLKSDPAVEPLADLVTASGAQDRVCVGSFSERRIRRFRRLTGGRVATALGPREVAAFRLLPADRLVDALTRAAGAALQVPHRLGRLQIVTPALIERAHALGKHVHVWTIDDPGQMRDLLDMGVDGLMTDRTDLLREVLLERGQWMGAPQ